MSPDFRTLRSLKLAGIRRFHTFAEAPQAIPKQWVEFMGNGELSGQIGQVAYGVTCQVNESSMEYMCAVEVDNLDDLPADTGKMLVPEQFYAVFTHNGHISGIGQAWDYIMQTWLPSSGATPVHTPCFELYDDRYDAESGEGEVEIWFPVERDTLKIKE